MYGGIGRAARNWDVLSSDPAAMRRMRDTTESLLIQLGHTTVAVFVPMPMRRGADRQLEPGAALGHVGALQRARSQGPDDLRQMTAGSCIYIGSQGMWGNLRDVCLRRCGSTTDWMVENGVARCPGSSPRGGRHGARNRWPRPWRGLDAPIECRQSRIDMRLRTRVPRPPGGGPGRGAGTRARSSAPGVGGPPRQCGRGVAGDRASRRASEPRHRPDLGPRPRARVLAGGLERRALGRGAEGRSRGGRGRGACIHREARACDARAACARRAHGRLRQQHPPGGEDEGVEDASRSRIRPAYIRRSFARARPVRG